MVCMDDAQLDKSIALQVEVTRFFQDKFSPHERLIVEIG